LRLSESNSQSIEDHIVETLEKCSLSTILGESFSSLEEDEESAFLHWKRKLRDDAFMHWKAHENGEVVSEEKAEGAKTGLEGQVEFGELPPISSLNFSDHYWNDLLMSSREFRVKLGTTSDELFDEERMAEIELLFAA
jgi:hypothetical protein